MKWPPLVAPKFSLLRRAPFRPREQLAAKANCGGWGDFAAAVSEKLRTSAVPQARQLGDDPLAHVLAQRGDVAREGAGVDGLEHAHDQVAPGAHVERVLGQRLAG